MSQNPPEPPLPETDPFDDFINHEMDFGADKPRPTPFSGFGQALPPRPSSFLPPNLDTGDLELDDDDSDDDEEESDEPSGFLRPNPFSRPRPSPFTPPTTPGTPPSGLGGRLGSTGGSFLRPPQPSSTSPFSGRPLGLPSKPAFGSSNLPAKTTLSSRSDWWSFDLADFILMALVVTALVLLVVALFFPDKLDLPGNAQTAGLEATIQAQATQIDQIQATLNAAPSK
jgi:hypothetical protein